MDPLDTAIHVINEGGSCTLTGHCEGCTFSNVCEPGIDLTPYAKEVFAENGLMSFTETNTKPDDYDDPRYQAETILDNGGECPGQWHCDKCHLAEHIPDGDCYMEQAMDAAEMVLFKINNCGRCKSIW